MKFCSQLFFVALLFAFGCKDEEVLAPIPQVKETIDVNAGNDLLVKAFAVELNGSKPKSTQNGEWSIISGLVDSKVFFENKYSYNSIFRGLPGENYSLVWTVKNLENQITGKDTVNIKFERLQVTISKADLASLATRRLLSVTSNYESISGKWSFSGDYHHIDPMNYSIPTEENNTILIYGRENGTIKARFTQVYGNISVSDSIEFQTGKYTQVDALADLKEGTFHQLEIVRENGLISEVRGARRIYQVDKYPALKALKHLKRIHMVDFAISLPDSFCTTYPELRYLNAELHTLPKNIGELKSLDTLITDRGVITSLPESFSNLKSLSHVEMGWCELSKLPEQIGNLANLKYFSIPSSILDNIPESFGNLTSLRYLNIGKVRNKLPESFGELKSLESLSLNGEFDELPIKFSQLLNLSYLNFSGPLKKLPSDLGNLHFLRELRMSGVGITSIPATIDQIDSLRLIFIAGNQISPTKLSLPENIGDVKNLEVLRFENFIIGNVPESIGNYSNLEALELWNCPIDSIPSSVGNLVNLEILSLMYCNLKTVPSSISNLAKLNKLWLIGNDLSFLPIEFKKLRLLELAINGNPKLEWQLPEIVNWPIVYLY